MLTKMWNFTLFKTYCSYEILVKITTLLKILSSETFQGHWT